MHRRTASLGLTLAVAFGETAAPALAQPPANLTAPDAAMNALMTVCKPAAERQVALDVVAEQSGYVMEDAPPTGLPIVRKQTRSWRVPSTTGEVHLVAGAIPEPAQASACMVAVYGDPMTGFEDVVAKRVVAPDLKFQLDPRQTLTTAQYHVDHYTAQQGYLSRNVLVIRPVAASPDHPTLSVIAYRVDYSWLKSISR